MEVEDGGIFYNVLSLILLPFIWVFGYFECLKSQIFVEIIGYDTDIQDFIAFQNYFIAAEFFSKKIDIAVIAFDRFLFASLFVSIKFFVVFLISE